MNRTMTRMLIVLITLTALCTIAFAQQAKQKVAVYMTGAEPKGAFGSHRMVGGELVKAFSNSAGYSAIDRTEAILAQLSKKHSCQRTGAMSNDYIKALGKQLGVHFLCIVNIGEVKGGFYLEVRMVDVETAEVERSATADSDLKDRAEMMRVAQGLAGELVGVGGQAQQAVTTWTPAPSSISGTGALTDTRDGKTYRTVRIGDRRWMAENLNFRTGNSVCSGNNESNCQKYGRLYDWNTARTACPAGWRLPANQDWNDLVQAAGGDAAGNSLKSKTGWHDRNDGSSGNGADEFDFSAMPGGDRMPSGSFTDVGTNGYWWSATEKDDDYDDAFYWDMDSLYDFVYEGSNSKILRISVRCVQD